MARLIFLLIGIVALVPLAALLMIMLVLGAAVESVSNPLNPEPSEFAIEDIPPQLLGHYRAASSSCPGLPWTVLAAIGKVESNHGRFGGSEVAENGEVSPHILGPLLDGSLIGTIAIPLGAGGSPWHTHTVFDRGLGPMQFLTDTFRSVGVDGNGDGEATPHNAIDAIHSAPVYLCNGEEELTDVRHAVFRYNRADVYVDAVMDLAARYGTAPLFAGADPNDLLNHPNVSMGPAQEADLAAGRIDPQLVAILLSVASEHTIYISSLATGHSLCVAQTGTYPDCRISRHVSGQAADIALFDGNPVNDSNRAARAQLLRWLPMQRNTNFLRPWNIGHPWGDLTSSGVGNFNDVRHEDHFHIAVTGTFAGAP